MSDKKSARARKEPERYTEVAAPKAKKARSKSPKKAAKGSKKAAAGKGKKAAKGTKKTKKAKDPNAPKRPTTAFFLFAADARAQVKKEHPSATVPEIGKLLGEKWASVSAAAKKKYEDGAAKDKARYQKEMAAYTKKA